MSRPVMTVPQLMSETSAILLDFDGPVCSVFAGVPDYVVAEKVRKVLRPLTALPDEVDGTHDPMEVLQFAGSLGDELIAQAVENALCTAEVQAIRTAAPTPFADQAIQSWNESGRPVVIVSNNSAPAITAYLARPGLRGRVLDVVGRVYGKPALMKPNPHLLLEAIKLLDVPASQCVLVGDSLSDIEAAQAAGVRSIGYANKPGKEERLASADVVITNMSDLVIGPDASR